jgi:phenylalanyl-tRNA synthetase alpha chain
LHEYEITVLNLLKRHKAASIDSLLQHSKLGRDAALWAVENLAGNGLVSIEREQEQAPRLTEEGKGYLHAFPEEKLVAQLSKSGGKASASKISDQIGIIWAKRNGWIKLEAGSLTLTEQGKEIAENRKSYAFRDLLNQLSKLQTLPKGMPEKSRNELKELGKRNLLEITERGIITAIKITEKGEKAHAVAGEEGIGALTREMLTKGTWEKERFRKYDINAPAEEAQPARLHPLHEFLDVIRGIWLNMGFTEVSGPIIESAFWNFDALFSPQDHPTRDMQDTFFLKNPSEISVDDIALMKRVKRMHLNGWKDRWREEVARQAILRTHTTSVSARSINRFATADEKSYPLKFFSVGRTFRNESIDYKHLAEFYMVDGIIIGNGLTLSTLIHTLKKFYAQLGMNDLVFRPSYFPFVEPGLEIYYRDKKKNDSIELGGAGIIRKEITKAMGTNKTVLAWGPGLDRLMFGSLGIDSISELYKNDVGWLRRRKELKI